jgi:hypothetical protein
MRAVGRRARERLRDIELAIQADNFTQAASRGHDLVSQLLTSRWPGHPASRTIHEALAA